MQNAAFLKEGMAGRTLLLRGCFGKVNGTEYIDYTIPTDLYYSCFDGCFDWDENKNNIYGEVSDKVDFNQQIFVTRAPIRNKEEAANFVNSVIEYESAPIIDNNILMTGCKLWNVNKEGKSDANIKGDEMYNNFITPYWGGELKKLYDTEKSEYYQND